MIITDITDLTLVQLNTYCRMNRLQGLIPPNKNKLNQYVYHGYIDGDSFVIIMSTAAHGVKPDWMDAIWYVTINLRNRLMQQSEKYLCNEHFNEKYVGEDWKYVGCLEGWEYDQKTAGLLEDLVIQAFNSGDEKMVEKNLFPHGIPTNVVRRDAIGRGLFFKDMNLEDFVRRTISM